MIAFSLYLQSRKMMMNRERVHNTSDLNAKFSWETINFKILKNVNR